MFHASLIFHSECQIAYVMGCLRELLTHDRRAMEPKQAVHDAYQTKLRDEIDQMVWSHPSITHSHYKNAHGKIHTVSPWPLYQYREWTKAPDPADYEFT